MIGIEEILSTAVQASWDGERADASDIQVTLMESDDSKDVEVESVAGSGPVVYFLR